MCVCVLLVLLPFLVTPNLILIFPANFSPSSRLSSLTSYFLVSSFSLLPLVFLYFSSLFPLYFLSSPLCTSSLIFSPRSLLTEEGDSKKLIRTTFWTRFDQSVRDDEHENMERVSGRKTGDIDGVVPGADEETGVVVEEIKLKGIEKSGGKEIEDEEEEEASVEEEEDLCEEGCGSRGKRGAGGCCGCGGDCPKRLCAWFCGLDGQDAQESSAQNEHLEKLTGLEQDPKAKTFLSVNLVIILLLGFFLFAVFSIKGHWKPGFWSL